MGVTAADGVAEGVAAVHAEAASLLQSLPAQMKRRWKVPPAPDDRYSSAAWSVKEPYTRTSLPRGRPSHGPPKLMTPSHTSVRAPQ